VGFRQQICRDLLVGGDRIGLMTRQADGAVDSTRMEPKQISTGSARMSAMLSRKMTPLVEAIELHEEPWIPPLPSGPIVRW
jgi:hypothetical protein